MADKPHINLIFIGHVDHGKSTLVGRLMWDSGAIPEKEMQEAKEEAEKRGKGTFAFAYLMDKHKEERERGVTIDLGYKEFNGKKNYFTIIDAPGHKDYIKNMITGTSQADAAVLVVAVKEGVMPQTKEHAWLAFAMGIRQIIVAINKMDEVNYDQKKFEEVRDSVLKLLKSLGYKENQVKFVPVSAWYGDNVTKKSDKMSWWNGPTLLEILDDLVPPPAPIDKPLRLPIQDVYTIKGIGTVPVGRVVTGKLKPGDVVVVMPSGKSGEVKSIEEHHKPLTEAIPGDNVGINIRGIGKGDVKRGDVIGHTNNPPRVAQAFTAQIFIFNHPTAVPKGYTPVLHIHTAQIAGQFVELQKKMNPATGEVIEENPAFLKNGDAALVKIKPIRPVCVEEYKDFPQLGRFVIRDMGQTIGAGIIVKVEDAPQQKK